MNATTNATISPSFSPSFSPTRTLPQRRHKPLPDWSNAPWAVGVGRARTPETCPPTPTASPTSLPTVAPNFLEDFLYVPSPSPNPPSYPSPNPPSYPSPNPPSYRYDDDDGSGRGFGFVEGVLVLIVLCGCIGVLHRSNANRNTIPSATLPVARPTPTNATTTARANGTTAQTRAAEHPARLVGGMNSEQREEHVKKSLTSVTIHLNGQDSTASSLQHIAEPSAPPSEGSTREDEDKFDGDESVAEAVAAARPAEISEVRMCSICCNDFENGDRVSFSNNPKCEHSFHTDCIAAWLKNHEDCPMCRQMFL